jgi:hypothetical protein
MLKTLKNIILVDETQPLEQIKKQYKLICEEGTF